MSYSKIMFKSLVIIFLLFSLSSCKKEEKYNSNFIIGKIPNSSKFEKMTKHEIRIDTLKEKNNKERLKDMMDGTAFIEGVTKTEKQKSIEYQKIMSQSYKYNRSRYYLQLMANEKPDNYFKGVDTLTTECDCYLNGDKIKIKMGMWLFGGFAFKLNLTKNKFTSLFWIDDHKNPIYKSTLSNTTLTDDVSVQNVEQSLILENRPKLSIGENLFGYMTFKTKNFYRLKNYKLDGNENRGDVMDTLNLRGSLYFKCKVRKKTFADE